MAGDRHGIDCGFYFQKTLPLVTAYVVTGLIIHLLIFDL